jgi:cobalt-zinc-cadmium efflux system outer membrane protein
VAQADVVQAGLLRNPVFSGRVRFADGPPSAANLEFDIAQEFLDLLMLPARKQLAAVQFDATRLRVANRVFDLVAEVRAAYFTLQAAQQTAAVLREIAKLAQASFKFARDLHQAGNISDLQLANEQAVFEQAKIELARSEAEALAGRERLNSVLGTWGRDANWTVPDRLPDVPRDEVPLVQIESLAITQRLDVAAAGKELETRARALGITKDWRWLATAQFGVSAERDTQWVLGPSLSLELPIFDQRQAAIAREEAHLRQAEKRLRSLAVNVRAEVRAARARLLSARELIEHYRSVIVPLRERIVQLTQQQLNYMLIGTFELLLARQNEINAYRDYINAVRDYWIARADLEHAVGGLLGIADAYAAPANRPRATGAAAHVE